MNKGLVIGVMALGLAGCTQQPMPRGIGFDDYAAFEIERAQRESALSAPRDSIVPPMRIEGESGVSSGDLARAGIGQRAGANSANDPLRRNGLDASPANAAPSLANNPGISDEQNFDAVSGRETIESDAQRRAAQAAAREQITPTAVPQRPGNTGPNIVEYAINAPNVKGQEWYSRSLLSGQGRFQRNCAGYNTPDDAQRDFLSRGGPERDRLGIDPDGDGFACGWDPAPFRQAFGN
ncbi:hypothetical protein ACJ5NV_00245 [Loktanella agnita]|uniref:hypothetical protein n=1 Tax=Loktanella agnita TaxID=287097 RepID=UPI0039882CD6